MLMYTETENQRWDNAYQWTTDELVEFLSMFPAGTPIHSDLLLHSRVEDGGELMWAYADCPDDTLKLFKSKDGSHQMLVPQTGHPVLYIREGTLSPAMIENIFDGKAKNLVKEAYDIAGKKKFLGMVFDVILEGFDDDDRIVQ